MACAFWIIVLISLFGRFSATQECSPSVTDKHLTYLDKLIDGQLYSSSWTIAINLLVKGPLTDYCYNKGIVHQLSYLLDNMTFKENSESQKLKVILEDLYTDEIASCTINSDIEKADIIKCSQTINLSPAEILQRVKHSFLVARDFRLDLDIDKECKALYGKCNDDNNNTTKEQQHNGRKKEPKESNLFTIFNIILTIVGLLCLCGLLYYRYHYRLLKRRLHRDRGLQLPEERPLQIPLDEIV
ncbi:macrophage colony-stimulating factor 1 isoform X3 [Mixophyes fleayi]|uniref:macrophage colony-stimulating factor 1 isoform X3 n=1 Tax=Mixophyes fleayi TaxID=3061075 RepID=UPI003F4DB04C